MGAVSIHSRAHLVKLSDDRHTAAPPTVYGTVMNYVALRLLGMGPDEGPMTEIRGLIHQMGGALRVPSWGKAWLSILGCYEWEGMNPVPPELWYVWITL